MINRHFVHRQLCQDQGKWFNFKWYYAGPETIRDYKDITYHIESDLIYVFDN